MLVPMKHIKHNLVGTNWKALLEADPILSRSKNDKNADYRTLEEYLKTVVNSSDTKAYGNRQKDLVLQNNLLFLRDTPKDCTVSVLLFIMPANKC